MWQPEAWSASFGATSCARRCLPEAWNMRGTCVEHAWNIACHPLNLNSESKSIIITWIAWHVGRAWHHVMAIIPKQHNFRVWGCLRNFWLQTLVSWHILTLCSRCVFKALGYWDFVIFHTWPTMALEGPWKGLLESQDQHSAALSRPVETKVTEWRGSKVLRSTGSGIMREVDRSGQKWTEVDRCE